MAVGPAPAGTTLPAQIHTFRLTLILTLGITPVLAGLLARWCGSSAEHYIASALTKGTRVKIRAHNLMAELRTSPRSPSDVIYHNPAKRKTRSMYWHNHYTKKLLTMKASGDNGRNYEVVSTVITEPVKVYSIEPTPYRSQPRRNRIGTVPTLALGVLVAEQTEHWEQNGDLSSEDEAIATAAARTREATTTGPRARYLMSVPVSQMATFQAHAPHIGLYIRTDYVPDDCPAQEQNQPIALPNLRAAVMAVNADLQEKDVEPRLREPHVMDQHSATSAETRELMLFLQNNYRWLIDGTMLENRWVNAGLDWSEITAHHPDLFPKRRVA